MTTRRAGITVGMRVANAGVERIGGGVDGELGEAAAITERFGVFSEVSSDWMGLCKFLSRCELAEFSWLS